MSQLEFPDTFHALTGKKPFPWQTELYKRFSTGDIPASCHLPTGLGKTSVIAIWLIALANGANGANIPRRLVYVVNRRTVVDQTTAEVVKYRDNLTLAGLWDQLAQLSATPATIKNPPLALSTLRGQFADNREWSADPSRPAVICGTVDMIGSRLLFSGYGVGWKSKPLHAGFLGQDTLIVHDEAHLEPAFQTLLEAIKCEQRRCQDFKPLRVMELTATSRSAGEVFELTPEDYENDIIRARINAAKKLHLHPLAEAKKPQKELIDKALSFKDKNKAILIFAYSVESVLDVQMALDKAKQKVITLTGTMRGLERDKLVEDDIFKRFLPDAPDGTETVYLVCTSAGEVGVNISANHLICDLSTFESMAQRLGRVNRFGKFPECEVHVYHPTEWDEKQALTEPRKKTLALLEPLQGKDVSPSVLSQIDAALRLDAFAPTPTILPVTDILFDAWALTTIKGKLPGRPPVEPYLHGVDDNDPPQTTIAWRQEVEQLTEELLTLNKSSIEEFLEVYPLKPHEELRSATYGKNKVFEQLEAIAERDAKLPVEKRRSAWVIDYDGSAVCYTLQALVEKDNQKKPLVALGSRTVILPPKAGGLHNGMLQGNEPFDEKIPYDVADEWYVDETRKERRRCRSDEAKEASDVTLREVLRIDIPPADEEGEGETDSLYWYVRTLSADDDGSKYSRHPVTWQDHTTGVTQVMKGIVHRLFPKNDPLGKALILAAEWHDLGKKRVVWQRSIGNPDPQDWHAKSGYDPVRKRKWRPLELTDYRHEFGSLLDIDKKEPSQIPEGLQDLVLHLIAAHHGRARPHFPADEVFDPERPQQEATELANTVPQRFGKLQRIYGRWGLAYLESLLRAADWAASAEPSKYLNAEAQHD